LSKVAHIIPYKHINFDSKGPALKYITKKKIRGYPDFFLEEKNGA